MSIRSRRPSRAAALRPVHDPVHDAERGAMPRPVESGLPGALLRRGLLATTALLPTALLLAAPAAAQAPNAAPSGGQVSAGSATISQSAATTRVDQASNRAVIDWQRFDVGRNHAVEFNQPSASSWTLNRVAGADPSRIAGQIRANGGVAIVNQSGVIFAEGAQVNVGSLIASAAGITNRNFMDGRMVFDQPANPGARVENHGTITVADRGLATLVGPGAANSGVIRARLGRVALAGAETYALDLAGDGLLSLDVTGAVRRAPEGAVALVTNGGTIEAAGGSVLLTADAARDVVDTLLRNTGTIRVDAGTGAAAGTVAIRGGAGGDVQVAGGAVTATGTAPGVRGGRVEVSSRGGAVAVARGARVDASGAAGGGTVQLGGAATRAVAVAGEAAARGTGAAVRGGTVAAQAKEAVLVQGGGKLDASGTGGGGTVLAGTTGVGRNQAMAARTTVERGAELRADATLRGDGGTVVVNSAGRTEMAGRLSARGGAAGGDGGFVEISGQRELAFDWNVDVAAPSGTAGTLLVDPVNIVVRDATATPPASPGEAGDGGAVTGTGTFATDGAAGDPTTIVVDVAQVQDFAGTVRLQATDAITVADAVTKGNGGLTLVAGNTIALNAAVTLTGAGDFTATAGTINGSGAVTVADGRTVSLRANTLGYSGALSAGATGLVEIGPRTDGGAFVAALPAGGVTAGTLRFGLASEGDRGDWGQDAAARGTTTAGALTVAASLDASGVQDLQLRGATVRVDDGVTVTGGAGTLSIQAANAITIGQTVGGGAVVVAPTGAVALETTGAASTITNRGRVEAGANLTVTAGPDAADATAALVNGGALVAGGNLTVRTAGHVINTGAASWMLAQSGVLVLQAGRSVALGDAAETGGNLTNAGTILAAGGAAGSRVAANGTLTNSGAIALWDGAGTAAGTVRGEVALVNAGAGRILAGTVGVAGASLTNEGRIGAASVLAGALANEATGLVVATGTVSVGSLVNAGEVLAGGVVASGAVTNTGVLRATGSVTAGTTIANSGADAVLVAGEVDAAGALANTDGRLAADTVEGGSVTNTGADAVIRAGTVRASGGVVENLAGAEILSGGRGSADAVALAVTGLKDAGQALAAARVPEGYGASAPSPLGIGGTGGPAALARTEGPSGGLVVEALGATGRVVNDAASIVAETSLSVRGEATGGAAGVANLGAEAWMLARTGALVVRSEGGLTNAGTMLAAGGAAGSEVHAAGTLTNSGAIALWSGAGTAAGTVRGGVALVNAGAGRILAGTVGVAGASLTNEGRIGAASVLAGALANEATGLVVANGTVSVGSLANAGEMLAGGVAVSGAVTNTGVLRATGSVTAGTTIANSGADAVLVAGGVDAAGALANTGGRLAADTVEGGSVTNTGADAVIRAGTVRASGGVVENLAGAEILSGGRGSADAVALAVTGLKDVGQALAAARVPEGYGASAPSPLGIGGTGGPAALARTEGPSGGLVVEALGATGRVVNDAASIVAETSLSVRGEATGGAAGVANLGAEAWMLARTGALVVRSEGGLTNAGTMLAAGGAAGSEVHAAGTLTNSGAIALWDGAGTAVGTVRGGVALVNAGAGRILAGTVGVAGASLTNEGRIGAASVLAGALANEATGLVVATGTVSVGSLVNAGEVLAGGVAASGSVANTGTLVAASAVSAGGDLANAGGTLRAASVGAGGTLTNGGLLEAHSVGAGADLVNTGTLAAASLEAGQSLLQDGGLIRHGSATVGAVTLVASGLKDGAQALAAARVPEGYAATAPGAVAIAGSGGAVAGAGAGLVATAGAGIRLGADVDAGLNMLQLRTDGAVMQPGGVVTAESLRIGGAAGGETGAASIAMNRANAVQSLTARATGAVGFTAANALTVLGVSAGGAAEVTAGSALMVAGNVTAGAESRLAGGSIMLGGEVDVGAATLNLRTDGAVTQTLGRVTAGLLNIRGAAGGEAGAAAVTMLEANRVGTLTAHATGAVGFRDADGLAVAGISAGGGVGVTAGSLAVDGLVTAGAASTLAGTAGIVLGAAVDVGAHTLTLRTDGAVTQTGGAVTAGRLDIRGVAGTPGAVSMEQANRVGALGAQATGAVAFRNAEALAVDGIEAGGAVSLTAPAIGVRGLVRSGAGQGITLTADALDASGAGRLQAEEAALAILPLTAGRPIVVGATAGGALGIGPDVVAAVDGATRALVVDGGAASGITIAGAADLQGRVEAVTLRGATIAGQAAGGVSATGVLVLEAQGSISLSGGAYVADRLVVRAGPAGDGAATIRISGTLFRVGTGMLLAAGGGIDAGARSTVEAADPVAGLPLVILETRRTATALRDLPGRLTGTVRTTDVAGRDPRAQTWQVPGARDANPPGALLFGVDDGHAPGAPGSGAASGRAAGNVVLNLGAGQNPVFLLVDGGTVSGTVEAGRLGVLGQAGVQRVNGDRVLELGGTLFGQSGSAAAQFGRASIGNPFDQALYRMNGCVLDTITCVAPSMVQPMPVPISTRIVIGAGQVSLDPEVLLPNVAEEDY